MSPGAGELVAAAVNAGKSSPPPPGGWTIGAIGIWLGIGTVVPLLITAMVKLLPVMRKLAIEREATIDDERRGDMVAMRKRMESLEQKIDQQRIYYEGRIEQERAERAAEISIMRHRANNDRTCLDALLMLIEAAPDKITEHVAKVKAMRESYRRDEATEKGAVIGIRIAAASAPVPPSIKE